MTNRIPLDELTSDQLDTLYDQLDRLRADQGAARTALTEVLTPVGGPAEHCGHQPVCFSEHTPPTECALRPGHSGSHADERGMRWWTRADREQRTSTTLFGCPTVRGRCPACGHEGLILGEGGYVTCPRIHCPEPDAASTLLEQQR